MKIEYLEIFNENNYSDRLDYYKNYDNLYQKKLTRGELIKRFSFAVPNEEAIKEIIKYSPIIEIGAGNGYWAYLIQKYGGDIIAFDNHKRDREWLIKTSIKEWIQSRINIERILENKAKECNIILPSWKKYTV